jgi:hypothetical protein
MEDYELLMQYDEMLNECHPMVTVCGMEYEPAYALKELDPIAYRVGFHDWLDSQEGEE